jgi:hypothetical protein
MATTTAHAFFQVCETGERYLSIAGLMRRSGHRDPTNTPAEDRGHRRTLAVIVFRRSQLDGYPSQTRRQNTGSKSRSHQICRCRRYAGQPASATGTYIELTPIVRIDIRGGAFGLRIAHERRASAEVQRLALVDLRAAG